MSTMKRRDLAPIVSATLEKALANGPFETGDLADTVIDQHRETVLDYALELARQALIAWFGRLCRGGGSREQLELPGIGARVPATITFACPDGKTRRVAFKRATVGQVRSYVELLSLQIQADTASLGEVMRVLAVCEEIGSSDDEGVMIALGRATREPVAAT